MTSRIPSVPATLALDDAAREVWDILIIGGGPSGAMAAREAALRGARTLLVDRNSFPRPKVCGCCINPAAIQVLERAGLKDLPAELGGCSLFEFRLASRGRQATVPLAGGVAISRDQFDAALMQSAIHSGAQFLDRTLASIQSGSSPGQVHFKREESQLAATARVVIVAAGLGSACFQEDAANSRRTSRRSRVGAGALVEQATADFPPGILSMACHRAGYVGVVRLEDGRLDLASALDPRAIKRHGGIARLVSHILRESGLPWIDSLEQENWHGTARLTQHRARVFGEGYFLVGDAAGYVEPFTGEGIAWALATGRAVVPFAIRAAQESTTRIGPLWSREYRRLLRRRMRLCRSFSLVLRRPLLVDLSVGLLARWPGLALPFQHSFNAAFFS